MKIFPLLFMLLLCDLLQVIKGVFNFEISAHVNSKILDYADMIARALKIPYYGYLSGVSNFTGTQYIIKTCQVYLYPLMLAFPEIQSIYTGSIY